MFIVHLGAMLWIMILTVVYMVNIVKNPVLKNEMKAVWAVAVFMANVFVMPIYWYLHIWRKKKDSSSAVNG